MNKKLRIGFDAKRYFTNKRGLGNYSRNLVLLLQMAPNLELYLFSSSSKASDRLTVIYPKGIYAFFKSLWRSFFIVKNIYESNIQIFHGLSNEIPFFIDKSRCKTIVTIHDVQFKILPDEYGFIDKIIYDFKTKYAVRNAHKIIAISEKTKQDLIHFYEIKGEEIQVIYQHCNPLFSKDKIEVLPKQNFFLSVGMHDSKKNFENILRAFKIFLETNLAYRLVAVGAKNKHSLGMQQMAHKLGISAHVDFHFDIDDLALLRFYENAEVLVFPSLYEGFGLPIIEALFNSCKVITTESSATREAGGDVAIYCDDSAESVANAMFKSICTECDIVKMENHLQQFSPKNIAKKWGQVYENLIED